MPNTSASSASPPVFAIVGGGFSGVMTAVHLARQATQPLHIRLFNKGFPLARGVAYSADQPFYLLNVMAGKMSAFPEQQGHFVQWLETQPDVYAYCASAEEIPSTFFPRQLYGRYLHHILTETIASLGLKPGVMLDVVPEEVTDLLPNGSGYTVLTAEGSSLPADLVVLALGNFPPACPVRAGLPAACNFYYPNPWLTENFTPAPQDTVLLIGTGLTTIDYLLLLKELDFKGKVFAVSPKGYLPQTHQFAQPYTDFKEELQPPYVLHDLVHRLNEHLRKTSGQGVNCPMLVDSLRTETQTIWQALSLDDKRRFLRHLSPLWNKTRHRIAPQIAAIVEDMQAIGQLRIISGRVAELQPQAQGITVCIEQKGKKGTLSITAQHVVNCTGPQGNYEQLDMPLVQNLLRRRLIQPDPLYLGLDALPNGAIISPEGGLSTSLFAIGPALRGILWESTAVPEIRIQAQQLAMLLLEKLVEEAV